MKKPIPRNTKDLTKEKANGPVIISFLPEDQRTPKQAKKVPYYGFRPRGGGDAS